MDRKFDKLLATIVEGCRKLQDSHWNEAEKDVTRARAEFDVMSGVPRLPIM